MKLSIRIDEASHKLGPGKIHLLSCIDQHSSIAAAARETSLSYGKAMRLIREMEAMFETSLVKTYSGGADRGGAKLTIAGKEVLRLYFEIISHAEKRAQPFLAELAQIKSTSENQTH